MCGPAGSGKSALLAGAAAALQAHPECLTYCVTVSCREISAEGASQAQAQILPKVGWPAVVAGVGGVDRLVACCKCSK